jgi:hypothetical protein
MLAFLIFNVVTLVACWIWGDWSNRTKCLLTALYLGTWPLLWIPFHAVYLFPIAQCAFAIVVGGMTFGLNWLNRPVR